jgi:uncharacterized membrane protein
VRYVIDGDDNEARVKYLSEPDKPASGQEATLRYLREAGGSGHCAGCAGRAEDRRGVRLCNQCAIAGPRHAGQDANYNRIVALTLVGVAGFEPAASSSRTEGVRIRNGTPAALPHVRGIAIVYDRPL